jgi:hypothetical protein
MIHGGRLETTFGFVLWAGDHDFFQVDQQFRLQGSAFRWVTNVNRSHSAFTSVEVQTITSDGLGTVYP